MHSIYKPFEISSVLMCTRLHTFGVKIITQMEITAIFLGLTIKGDKIETCV